MNDITLLKTLNADVPEADDVALRRARRRLIEKAVGPAVARRRRYRRMAVRLGGVAAAAAVIVGIGAARFDSNPVGSPAAATEVLQRATAVASAAEKHAYVHTTHVVTLDGTVLWTAETWIPRDEKAPWVQSSTVPGEDGPVTWVFDAPQPGDDLASVDPMSQDGDGVTRPSEATIRLISPINDDIPRGEAELSAWLTRPMTLGHDRKPASTGEAAIRRAGRILAATLTPPELRTRVFKALSTIKGVTVDEDADFAGRPAVSLTSGHDDRSQLFFAEDGTFLGSITIGADDDPGSTAEQQSALTYDFAAPPAHLLASPTHRGTSAVVPNN
ncbi:hypothetical protein GCM10022234_25940 [Aeromicrobium panaciterrae]|uniref:hypothetical protein n=1 Tax=Aeromicrobium panaciterrae TaxID=363861 RepID=UPI0031CFDEC7